MKTFSLKPKQWWSFSAWKKARRAERVINWFMDDLNSSKRFWEFVRSQGVDNDNQKET